jgi:transposase-like protein
MATFKDVITQIRKATRRNFSADEKIRIVLEGLRGETPISEICRREGIASSVYYTNRLPAVGGRGWGG